VIKTSPYLVSRFPRVVLQPYWYCAALFVTWSMN